MDIIVIERYVAPKIRAAGTTVSVPLVSSMLREMYALSLYDSVQS